jgi:acetylornithine deacetylase/succinyl-diaminopimelate desuccinylase-like protein
MDTEQLRKNVTEMMPEVVSDLEKLVAIPSCAFPGHPAEPVNQMCDATVEMLQRYGLTGARKVEVPGGYPAVYGEQAGPPGSPTVMMYAHYDVQPAPKEQGWDTEPFVPTRQNGRIFGRGAADDKSGIAIHAGTVRALAGKPPVNLKIIVEGEEETISHLGDFVYANREMFQADAFIVADMGNLAPGEPAVTSTLRGHVHCIVEVRTLDHPLHSGEFGGVAPDALVALIRMLATLHHDDGEVAIKGLTSFEWSGGDYPEATYRSTSAILDGVQLIGRGTVGSRLWSKPSVSVLGIDCPSVDGASNVLLPSARARVALRIAPGADADHEVETLMEHLRSVAPWGVKVECSRGKVSNGFAVDREGPAYAASKDALTDAYAKEAGDCGSGGSIPLLDILKDVAPEAEFVLWGAEDLAMARIHASNESVDPSEIEHMILAQSIFLHKYSTADKGNTKR